MRWERRWQEDKSFISPDEYPPESMATVSTHDSETLRQWWESYPEEARPFAEMLGMNYSETLTPSLRMQVLRACHRAGSLFHINLLQEYLGLIPEMSAEKPEEERINLPGTLSDLNWTTRFKPSVEEIISHPELKHAIHEILSDIRTRSQRS
jgi:4-alpha-glucanotransferase